MRDLASALFEFESFSDDGSGVVFMEKVTLKIDIQDMAAGQEFDEVLLDGKMAYFINLTPAGEVLSEVSYPLRLSVDPRVVDES